MTGLEPAPVSVGLTYGHLSDLFFNYTHEHYDLAVAEAHDDDRAITEKQAFAAILKDAEEFVECYPFGVDAQWFADDFMKRV